MPDDARWRIHARAQALDSVVKQQTNTQLAITTTLRKRIACSLQLCHMIFASKLCTKIRYIWCVHCTGVCVCVYVFHMEQFERGEHDHHVLILMGGSALFTCKYPNRNSSFVRNFESLFRTCSAVFSPFFLVV